MAQSDGPKAGANGSGRSRCIALVGPYLSGKTTLLEAILGPHAAPSRGPAASPTRRASATRAPRPATTA